ncbi:lytic polysaccharide monooxygenase, partial [Amniculicola lignicola CBS 123094]
LAHWNYDRLIHNGAIVGDYYTYIRKTDNSNSPITDITSTNMRCNSGGASGNTTETYAVSTGDEVGFMINSNFGHPGPQQVYLSKAPSTAAEYDGSGDWVKIYSATTNDITDQGLQWAMNGVTNFSFALPGVDAGEYLLRAEGLALHGAGSEGGAQWYIGCAQISVGGAAGNGTTTAPLNGTAVGGGTTNVTANLDSAVKIPGLYTVDEPGILINIYYPVPTNYTAPGPALWPLGTEEVHTVAGMQ